MAQRWRYVRNGQEYGPVTTSDLRLLADSERLQTTDLVCKDGSTHWVAAGSVKGLFYTPGAPRRTSGWAATCVIVVATIALLTVGGVIYLVYTLYGSVPNNASPGPQHHVIRLNIARSWRITTDVGSNSAYPDLSARDAAAMREIDGKG